MKSILTINEGSRRGLLHAKERRRCIKWNYHTDIFMVFESFIRFWREKYLVGENAITVFLVVGLLLPGIPDGNGQCPGTPSSYTNSQGQSCNFRVDWITCKIEYQVNFGTWLPDCTPSTNSGNAGLNNIFIKKSAYGLDYCQQSVIVSSRANNTAGGPWANPLPHTTTISCVPTGTQVLQTLILFSVEHRPGATLPPPVVVNNNSFASIQLGTGTNQPPSNCPCPVQGNSCPNKCWGTNECTKVFWADISSAVTGNGNYTVDIQTGANKNYEVDGFTILVIYQDPNSNFLGHLVIEGGALVSTSGNPYGFTDPVNVSVCETPVKAKGFVIVSDLQKQFGADEYIDINGTKYAEPKSFWMFSERPITLLKNQTSVHFGVSNLDSGSTTTPSKDCFAWMMQGVHWQTTICTTNCNLTLTPAVTADNCGACDGSVTVSVSGGTPPYTFLWDASCGNKTGPSITGMCGGTCKVSVQDAGCKTSQITVTIPVSCGPPAVEITGGYVCPGGCVNITATSSGGTPPYTYSWSPSGPGNSTGPYNACPASTTTYTVTITDKNGATTTDTAVVTVNPALNVSGTKTDILCSGANNGSGTASPSGGTAPYTYTWSPSGGTASTANNLSPGTYTVAITDNRGCSQTATVQITEPAALSISSAKTDVSCSGGSNGSATITPTGGTSPYTYFWSPSGGSTSAAGSLTAGIYTVTVTDNKGCTKTATAQVSEPAPVNTTTTKTDVTCNRGTNGSGTITSSGGTSPYTYLWNTTPPQTSSTAIGLSAGMYTVTITDYNGCTQTATTQITEPSAVTLTTGSTPAQCGQSNGTANVTPNGGTAPYTYTWNTGATGNSISNVSGTTYTVTVTDNKGCTITTTVAVPSTGATTASITNSTNVSCKGGSNGSATANGGGGIAPFTYTWSNGNTGTSTTGLTAGTYTITVTDATGCPATASVTIIAPNAINLVAGKTDANCGGSDGTATVTPSGGAGAPFSYTWSNGGASSSINGISQGTYTVTVTDANGCTNSTTVTVNDIGSPTLSTNSTNIKCSSASTGSITSTVTGGVLPYTYAWSSGQTTPSLSNIPAGTYTLTVSGQNGCKSTEVVNITEPSSLSTTTGKTDANCGKSDGSATVNVSGGTSPYSFLWSGGGTTNIKSTSPAGTYTVTITDANGCTTTAFENIDDIGAPSITSIKTDNLCFGGSQGTASAIPSGGILPYTYLWSNGSTIDNISSVPAGTYTVTVIGNNGCKVTTTVTIIQPNDITLAINSTDELCGSGNGTATVTAQGGTGAYSYQWAIGSRQSAVSNLSAGNYSVTVTDANGCSKMTATSVVNISDYGPKSFFTMNPSVTEILTPTVKFFDQTGGLTAWNWNFGDGTTNSVQNPVHTYKDTGTYNACLSVTNQYGCASDYCLPVVVKPIWSFYVPNAFTPDGDERNDFFSGYGFGITEYEMYIFDRWGDLLFKSNDMTKQWDGKSNDGNNIVQEDVYVYLFIVRDIFGKQHRYTGSVTVIK